MSKKQRSKPMRGSKSIFYLLSVFLFSIFLSSSIRGGIKGKIIGEAQNPIEGVNITILSVEYPSEQYKLKTNTKGEFIQIGLEPGYYFLQCEKEGYAPVKKQVKVAISEIAETTIILSPIKQLLEIEGILGKKESQKGYILFQEGKYEEALHEYQAAVLKNPEEANHYYNLGVTYMALGRNKEAIEAFKKTINVQPGNLLALKSLGQLFAKEKEYKQASHYLSLAANISSSDPEVFYNLGVSLLNMANYPGALDAFQKTIACQKNYGDAYYQLGLLYLNQNEKDKALINFEKFLEISPDDSKVPNVKKMIELIKKENMAAISPGWANLSSLPS
jgi:tetratricopeptide (TPR) repeat protein